MKYYNTYFRVNTKAYHYNDGFTEQGHKAFNDEVEALFTQNGWSVKAKAYNGHCMRVEKGVQNLYMHPQSFSGTVANNEIKLIEEFIKAAKTFEFYKTDIYEELHDMDDETYHQYLLNKKAEAELNVLQLLKTTRSTLYINSLETVAVNAIKAFKLKRLCDKNSMINKVELEFVSNMINELVAKGYIIQADIPHTKAYRTINKTEQKKLKVRFDF